MVATTVAVAAAYSAPVPAHADPVKPAAPASDSPAPAPASGAPTLVIETCPALYALGVQGTGESSPDAAPTTDTGMLSMVFMPMLARAAEPGLVERAYVPYEAGFGGVDGGSAVPYLDSVLGGLERLRAMAGQVAERCPRTRLALAGYSQGAHVVSMFAQEVGSGAGVVPAEKVAAVALFADPTRAADAPLFPGAPGRLTPDPAPGVAGERLAELAAAPRSPARGGGIGPERDRAADFGALTGRVAGFCAAGDLACDAPPDAPILRVVTNIAGQSRTGGDPVAALLSVGQALAYTSIRTAAIVAAEDLTGATAADISLSPRKSIAERLADASDPRTALDAGAVLHGLLRVGLIGFNAVTAVVREVLDPAVLSELARAGLADPAAGLALLGGRLAGAVPELVPPTTISRLVTQAYDEVVRTVTDERELLDLTTWVRYWDTARQHGAYHTERAGSWDVPPTRYVAEWFAATARDLAEHTGAAGEPASAPAHVDGGSTGTAPGASATPNSGGAGQFPFGTGADGASSGGVTSIPPTVAPGVAGRHYPFSTN
ncbi:MAG TPA: cutinase family protein [Nocardia sp.]|uniref:cutinase family protein n=1 Tax=Nocardia sp. TaxID=1821 RepID=UPI002B4AE624|nr:cutinase family protein [Nocardia sp.]HLS75646.1 cutinase family protein [Nocardia sp.]